MAIFMYLRTGQVYQLRDGLTLADVNGTLTANAGKFFEVPLSPDQPVWAGVIPGGQVRNLFIVPDAVSHFVNV